MQTALGGAINAYRATTGVNNRECKVYVGRGLVYIGTVSTMKHPVKASKDYLCTVLFLISDHYNQYSYPVFLTSMLY